jgi:hypothetical protein
MQTAAFAVCGLLSATDPKIAELKTGGPRYPLQTSQNSGLRQP